jgi:hypothetical protein
MAPRKKAPPAFRFPPVKQAEFLGHLRAGMRRGAAADTLKLERLKVREFIAAHPEFLVLVEDAELDANEHVEEALYQAAISGSVPAAKTWLELKGVQFPEHRGRPANPLPEIPPDPFADLGNVEALDPRRRRKQMEDQQ